MNAVFTEKLNAETSLPILPRTAFLGEDRSAYEREKKYELEDESRRCHCKILFWPFLLSFSSLQRARAAALNLICKAANADSAFGRTRTDELTLGVKSICWDLGGAFTMQKHCLMMLD